MTALVLALVAGWLLAAGLLLAALGLRARLDQVARAAHELRGAGTALRLGVELLRRDAGGRRRAAPLRAALDRLELGVSDLEAARAGARRAARDGPVALEPLARRAALAFEPAMRTLCRDLRVEWRAGQVRLGSGGGRLQQALANLLSNAVEHGSGRVELRGERADGRIRIEVRDEGGDAPAEAAQREHAGSDPPRVGRRRDPARGHGLAIAARAVEEAGGSLRLEPQESGAKVAIDLPASEP